MGNSQSKVDLYAAIRRDHQMGMSLRALQRTHNVTWRIGPEEAAAQGVEARSLQAVDRRDAAG
ncbi:hypothetical protein ABZ443_32325 [Streptomyces shenzhenensis]